MLVLCELVFQRLIFSEWEKAEFLREPGAYADIYADQHENIYSQEYWTLYNIFGKFFRPPEIPHPLLGWVGKFDRDDLVHWEKNKVKGRRPVLLFGDSFSYCVGAKCFEDFLNEDSAFSSKYYLLNYGVGGYGVDQIYLLSREVIPMYDDPIVIFGMMTRDMDRSILKFRTGQKPYFEIADGQLELKGVPMEPKASYFIERNMPEITSYLFRYLRNSLSQTLPENHEKTMAIKEKIKTLNDLILKESHQLLEQSGLDYRFLVFSPVYQSDGEWREIDIRNFLEKNHAPYIFTKDIFKADSNFSAQNLRFFEADNGHPTAYLNGLISDEIKRCIMDSAYASIVDSLNSLKYESVKNSYNETHLDHYIMLIKNDAVWLASIDQKASDKGISRDSMLKLDAAWLMEMDRRAKEMGISRDSLINLEASRQLKQGINN